MPGFDYASAGAYFITICTHARASVFGGIVDGAMRYNAAGRIIDATWRELTAHYPNLDLGPFVVMPNHVHAIVLLKASGRARSGTSLNEVVRGFKTFTARAINRTTQRQGSPVWQRGFYEHVIRNERAFAAIAEYIANNPRQWAWDHENPARHVGPEYTPWLSVVVDEDGRV